ncbi:CLUMA_CG013200, isoform A [Clunio marinus]|uniref:CLUMA_CG013200, isoform A n=1 Tax=Clunio marinus TaxID=568069 RepID=A0A1J1IN42_9DIPT|nr:CLUMA_CG013200, isoform A [Clunio marinus]
MKSLILLINTFVAVTLTFAQKQTIDDNKYRNIPIIALENKIEHDGSFRYSFENGDGTRAEQNGELKYVDNENAGEAVQGGYSYQGDDGKVYSLTYTADENGYRPVGDFLPTPPPIPPAIARAVEYLKSLPPPKQ